MTTTNSFGSKSTLKVGDKSFTIYKLSAVEKTHPAAAKLPFSLKILLECLLRTEDGLAVTADDIKALAAWNAKAEPDKEIAFTPSRVLLQDFTGVPAVVDLAAMRDAMKRMGGDPNKINPLQPVELVIDHSVQVDEFGTPKALLQNADLENARNRERYQFLRWGQTAFANFRVVPPDQGIVHQVNLEYLARVVFTDGGSAQGAGRSTPEDGGTAYPDTLVGTDSHTTMVNGLGVLGWGVGGIEAEAAMLGQPVSMLIPQVVGMKLTGKLPEGATATDLVLTVTQMLRKKGVVGKFVEFYGSGLSSLALADRATIANMAPEYGATCGIFPVDDETLRYLRFSGRPEAQIQLVEAYCKEQGLFHTKDTAEATYSDTLELDLSKVEPSLAGPTRPQDRVRLADAKTSIHDAVAAMVAKKAQVAPAKNAVERLKNEGGGGAAVGASDSVAHHAKLPRETEVKIEDTLHKIGHGAVVIAAITSCTNTSNPSVLMAAGLLAKKAVEKGLKAQPWVKTSLAPGSKVVTEYLQAAGLLTALEQLRFNIVGYGCTTCIGNSGPLLDPVSKAIAKDDLVAAAVLSGNRNFEGRVHPEVRANYLASPPLVVAYAIAGTMDIDMATEPLGTGKDGKPVFLKDIWPSNQEVAQAVEKHIKQAMYQRVYAEIFKGDEQWAKLQVPEGNRYQWDETSTYVKHPPYFDGMTEQPAPLAELKGARCLALLGDSITTDHISPAGSIKESGPAGKYLVERGVNKKDFNSYGARRGNHEVMVRGTFANVRLRNLLAPGTEGGVTRHLPSGEPMSIFDAAMRYEKDKVPALVLGGKEYGSGSSRDWAAKGPKLLGVRAVIAESYERIHRSNLVGMGILPLQFKPGETAASLGLTGEETFDVDGVPEAVEGNFAKGRDLKVKAHKPDGSVKEFTARARIDTPQEVLYYRHGGILPYVLRQLLAKK
jgi:aconitate hydratase